jgi:hypothetical protein
MHEHPHDGHLPDDSYIDRYVLPQPGAEKPATEEKSRQERVRELNERANEVLKDALPEVPYLDQSDE